MVKSFPSDARIHVVRLKPGDDLKRSLLELAALHQWNAAVVVTCAGSLVSYNLRFANRKEGSSKTGHFEIVSLTGTLSASSAHLHICISDENGETKAGHLLEGNRIYTTAEIAIAELPTLEFRRVLDPVSGYAELQIAEKKPPVR